jgi:hypothetical protein
MKFKQFLVEKEAETYEQYFAKVLKKYKVEDPTELSDEDQKKFYDEIEAGWNSEDEEGKDGVTEEKVETSSEYKKAGVNIHELEKLLSPSSALAQNINEAHGDEFEEAFDKIAEHLEQVVTLWNEVTDEISNTK